MLETEATIFAAMKERPRNFRVTGPSTAELLNQCEQLPISFFLLSEKNISCYFIRYCMLDFSYSHPNAIFTDLPSKYQIPSVSIEYWSREKVMELNCLGSNKLLKSFKLPFTLCGSIRTNSLRGLS